MILDEYHTVGSWLAVPLTDAMTTVEILKLSIPIAEEYSRKGINMWPLDPVVDVDDRVTLYLEVRSVSLKVPLSSNLSDDDLLVRAYPCLNGLDLRSLQLNRRRYSRNANTVTATMELFDNAAILNCISDATGLTDEVAKLVEDTRPFFVDDIPENTMKLIPRIKLYGAVKCGSDATRALTRYDLGEGLNEDDFDEDELNGSDEVEYEENLIAGIFEIDSSVPDGAIVVTTGDPVDPIGFVYSADGIDDLISGGYTSGDDLGEGFGKGECGYNLDIDRIVTTERGTYRLLDGYLADGAIYPREEIRYNLD